MARKKSGFPAQAIAFENKVGFGIQGVTAGSFCVISSGAELT
jgi:hypothetical protein